MQPQDGPFSLVSRSPFIEDCCQKKKKLPQLTLIIIFLSLLNSTETATGRTQLNPPMMSAGPPQAYPQQTPGYQYPQQPASNGLAGNNLPQTPPPPGPSAGAQPPKTKRVYAANQAQAYYGGEGGGGGGAGLPPMDNNHSYQQGNVPASAQFTPATNTFFTPGQPQIGQAPAIPPNQAFQPTSYDHHQQQPQGSHYPQQSQYPTPANPQAYADPVGDLSQQFQGMGMGQKAVRLQHPYIFSSATRRSLFFLSLFGPF
jgi:protein transport protein SEC24